MLCSIAAGMLKCTVSHVHCCRCSCFWDRELLSYCHIWLCSLKLRRTAMWMCICKEETRSLAD